MLAVTLAERIEHISDKHVVGDNEGEVQVGEAIAAVHGKRAHGGSGNDASLLAELAYDDAVMEWLLAGDPAVRWQVMRDLLDESVEVWEGERRRVAETGWGAAMLERRGPAGWPKERWTDVLCSAAQAKRALAAREPNPRDAPR
jgi:hypothetical protein